MKKIFAFAFVALISVASYTLAAETANKTEETATQKVSVLEETANVEAPKAEKAQPNAPVAANAGTKTQPARRYYTRQEIRSMDILDRPNRPGHFYGNTVRRRHGR